MINQFIYSTILIYNSIGSVLLMLYKNVLRFIYSMLNVVNMECFTKFVQFFQSLPEFLSPFTQFVVCLYILSVPTSGT